MAFPNFWWGSFGKNLSTPLKRLPACRRLLFPYVCTQATEKSAFTFVNLLSLKVIHLPSQRCDVLQGLLPPPPATIETSVKFRHFAELYCRSCQQITLKPGKFTSFRAFFFQRCRRIFANWFMSKVEKPRKGLFSKAPRQATFVR